MPPIVKAVIKVPKFSKTYTTTFSTETIRGIVSAFSSSAGSEGLDRKSSRVASADGGEWSDLSEEEFYRHYSDSTGPATLCMDGSDGSVLWIRCSNGVSQVTFGPTRPDYIAAVFNVADEAFSKVAILDNSPGIVQVAPVTLYEMDIMRAAIAEARQSVAEDGRAHPYVGCVVVRDGKILGKGHRGELGSGEHAEFTVLERKLASETLAGSILYATLEPCTCRNPPKLPCATHIQRRQIRKVVIGMLDPNQTITGKGVLSLRRAGIEVQLFPFELMRELEELNRHFIASFQTG
jgi:pyrimidine deaminase RibD-like protein